MDETGALSEASKKKQANHWLLWWKIRPEELQKQIAEYHTLKITQSARGISVLALLFTAALTAFFAHLKWAGLDEWSYGDAALLLFLCIFIYRGHKWAILLAMIYWTYAKAFQIYSSLGTTPHPVAGQLIVAIIWWSTYMHAFFLAFIVEKKRRSEAKASGGT